MQGEIDRLYKTKCKKYSPDKLTQDLKLYLYCEAVSEVKMMNYFNSCR